MREICTITSGHASRLPEPSSEGAMKLYLTSFIGIPNADVSKAQPDAAAHQLAHLRITEAVGAHLTSLSHISNPLTALGTLTEALQEFVETRQLCTWADRVLTQWNRTYVTDFLAMSAASTTAANQNQTVGAVFNVWMQVQCQVGQNRQIAVAAIVKIFIGAILDATENSDELFRLLQRTVKIFTVGGMSAYRNDFEAPVFEALRKALQTQGASGGLPRSACLHCYARSVALARCVLPPASIVPFLSIVADGLASSPTLLGELVEDVASGVRRWSTRLEDLKQDEVAASDTVAPGNWDLHALFPLLPAHRSDDWTAKLQKLLPSLLECRVRFGPDQFEFAAKLSDAAALNHPSSVELHDLACCLQEVIGEFPAKLHDVLLKAVEHVLSRDTRSREGGLLTSAIVRHVDNAVKSGQIEDAAWQKAFTRLLAFLKPAVDVDVTLTQLSAASFKRLLSFDAVWPAQRDVTANAVVTKAFRRATVHSSAQISSDIADTDVVTRGVSAVYGEGASIAIAVKCFAMTWIRSSFSGSTSGFVALRYLPTLLQQHASNIELVYGAHYARRKLLFSMTLSRVHVAWHHADGTTMLVLSPLHLMLLEQFASNLTARTLHMLTDQAGLDSLVVSKISRDLVLCRILQEITAADGKPALRLADTHRSAQVNVLDGGAQANSKAGDVDGRRSAATLATTRPLQKLQLQSTLMRELKQAGSLTREQLYSRVMLASIRIPGLKHVSPREMDTAVDRLAQQEFVAVVPAADARDSVVRYVA